MKTPHPKYPTLSAFVQVQPMTLPIKEVVELGIQEGLPMTYEAVRSARHRMVAKSKREAQISSLEVATSLATSKYCSFSAFVRAQPMDLPVQEVIALAAKEGLRGNRNLVYTVRHQKRRRSSAQVAPLQYEREMTLLVLDLGISAVCHVVDQIDQLGLQGSRQVIERVRQFARQPTASPRAKLGFLAGVVSN